jgi:hypothetical protein
MRLHKTLASTDEENLISGFQKVNPFSSLLLSSLEFSDTKVYEP